MVKMYALKNPTNKQNKHDEINIQIFPNNILDY